MALGSGLPVQGAAQWLRLTKESVYNQYDPAGAFIWVVMAGDTPFNAAITRLRTIIRSADTSNRKRNNINTKYTIAGGFNSPFYPSQAGFLLDLATNIGTSSPHALTSVTADWFDGQTPRRLTGGKVESLNLNADAATQYATMNMNWRFSAVDDTSLTTANFPPPGCAELPWEEPYHFNELAGYFTFGITPSSGTAVKVFDQMNISFTNILTAPHYENPWVEFIVWSGRDVGFQTNLAYLDTTWRDAYEKQQMLTFNVTYYRSATQQAQLNFWTRNYVAERPQQSPLAGIITQGVTAESYYDCSATPNPTDFSYNVLYS
jgi:hypothetical protein